jgi:(p)ppGpp synthase/HD superfamily hydrolase
MATLERAIQIAVEAHAGVLDKGGKPYILHPLRIMLKGSTDEERIVRVLHDVVEDSEDWTLERLREEGFNETVVQCIDNLSRRDDEHYDDFIERCGSHLISLEGKLDDIEDNMQVSRIVTLEQKDFNRMKKYHKARRRLLEIKALFHK